MQFFAQFLHNILMIFSADFSFFMTVYINSQIMKDQSLNCPKCFTIFSQSNPPKSLINCSHNLCFNCLQEEIICPIDRSRIQMRKYKIESFHTNNQILQRILKPINDAQQVENCYPIDQQACTNISRCISKINQQNFIFQGKAQSQLPFSANILQKQITLPTFFADNPLINPTNTISPSSITKLNPNAFQICLLHSKRADLVCIEDKKLICSDCGLFGNHKLHQLITYEKFIERFSEMTEECFQIFKELQLRKDKLSSQLIQQEINRRLLKKKEEQLLKIKKFIRFYSDLLRATQKELTFNLQLLLNYKKQKLMQSYHDVQLKTKINDFFKNVQRMSEGLSQVFNCQNLEQYISFLDESTKDSQIQKTGLYLIVQIDNFDKMKSEKIEKEFEDFQYSFNNISNLFLQTYTLESKELAHISTIIQQSKQKNSKLSKMGTPSKNTTVLIQTSKGKGSSLQNMQQQNLLSPQKNNQQESPLKNPSRFLQSLNFSLIQSGVTQAHQNNVSQFSTSRILTLPKSTQRISKNGSSQKLEAIQFENDSENKQRIKSKSKSNAKNSNDLEFFNILGQKNTYPKKKKKLQLPQKLVKVYEDLLKDKLEVLDLGKGYLGNTNVLLISDLFPSRSHLKVVKLMNNRITDEIFVDLVSKCIGVTSLNLGGNQLSERSLEWLQREAGNLGELKNITLSCNKIVLRNVKERLQILKERGLNVSL